MRRLLLSFLFVITSFFSLSTAHAAIDDAPLVCEQAGVYLSFNEVAVDEEAGMLLFAEGSVPLSEVEVEYVKGGVLVFAPGYCWRCGKSLLICTCP